MNFSKVANPLFASTKKDTGWILGGAPPSLVSTLPLNFVSWKKHWPVSGWQDEGPDGEQGGCSTGIKR